MDIKAVGRLAIEDVIRGLRKVSSSSKIVVDFRGICFKAITLKGFSMPALIINNMRSIPILLLVAGLSFGDRYAPIERAVKDGTSRAPVVDILSTPVSINVRNVALPYLLSLISQEVKYPIVLRDIAYPLAGQVQTQTQTQTLQTPMPQASQTQTAQSEYLTVSYFADKKPLRQVLDEITGTLDLWWKKEDGRIVIYKYESRA